MKAIEYYEKYKDLVNTKEGIADLFIEMSLEVETLVKQRNSKSNDTVRAIIKEINQKWNALSRIFEKKIGQPLLIENGFLNYWKKKISMND